MAAVKEAFERDSRRLAFEREQLDEERARAERLLRLELRRQAADREVARLRWLAGVATAGLLAACVSFGVMADERLPSRLVLGIGWVFLLVAVAAAFVGQQRISDACGQPDNKASGDEALDDGCGRWALWAMVVGFALVGVAIVIR